MEIGNIWFGLPLQRTTAATEAIFLLAPRVRRARLPPPRVEVQRPQRAVARAPHSASASHFEGIFRKHQVVKGRNRDTAWFSITDDDWPAIRTGFQAWLAPANMSREEQQKRTLSELISEAREQSR